MSGRTRSRYAHRPSAMRVLMIRIDADADAAQGGEHHQLGEVEIAVQRADAVGREQDHGEGADTARTRARHGRRSDPPAAGRPTT